MGYVVLLVLSHVAQRGVGVRASPTADEGAVLPGFDEFGTLPGRQVRMYVQEWPARGEARGVVVLLHGSPGKGGGFARVAEPLARDGYLVLAPDLPGFGRSTLDPPSVSVKANAMVVLAELERRGIARAHVMGWSNGGGTALHMADIEPGRVASVALVASIGVQEFEGTGVHAIEHAKYAAGMLVFGRLPDLFPHFGAWGRYRERIGWLRNFAETDQRELRGVMERVGRNGVPVLIVHGREDRLVPVAAAEESHRLMPRSGLRVWDADHFMPFTHAPRLAGALAAFFTASEHGGVLEGTRGDDEKHDAANSGVGVLRRARDVARAAPWWVHGLLMVLFVGLTPGWTIAAAALLVALGGVDVFIAGCGVLLGLWGWCAGRAAWGRNTLSRVDWTRRVVQWPVREGWRAGVLAPLRARAPAAAGSAGAGGWRKAQFFVAMVCGLGVVAGLGFFVSLIGAAVTELVVAGRLDRVWGVPGVVGVFVSVWATSRLVRWGPALLSVRGWRWLRRKVERTLRFEYWPIAVVYAPVFVYSLWLGIRHRGYSLPGKCNPGIENGGGIVGESKARIMRMLGDGPEMLATVLVARGGGSEERAAAALAGARERGITQPFVLKPDSGQRGFGFKVARSEADVEAYFEAVTTDVVVQRFHPGPGECGILWMRHANGERDGRLGRIFSVTGKEFPRITGDGGHTLEELLERHPRFRRQSPVFLERLRDEATRVPERGEVVKLAVSGNHCQGTRFTDAGHLATPGLEATIDRLVRGFGRGTPAEDGLDMVRFDVRYADEAALTRGEGFGIVEMNGTSSESTNVYDPDRSLYWAYGVILRQLRELYALGERRREEGVVGLRVRDVFTLMFRHHSGRRGSEVAD